MKVWIDCRLSLAFSDTGYIPHHDICPADSHSPLTVASQLVCRSESSLNTEIPEIHLLLLEGVQERATVSKDSVFLPSRTQNLMEVST